MNYLAYLQREHKIDQGGVSVQWTHQFSLSLKIIQALLDAQIPVCVLLRGLPGTGKSSICRFLREEYFNVKDVACVSADSFFTDPQTQVYTFDETQLKAAHQECQKQFEGLLRNGKPLILVDNTNILQWEMQQYTKKSYLLGYVNLVLEPDHFDDLDLALFRNQSNSFLTKKVDADTLRRRKAALDKNGDVRYNYTGLFVNPRVITEHLKHVGISTWFRWALHITLHQQNPTLDELREYAGQVFSIPCTFLVHNATFTQCLLLCIVPEKMQKGMQVQPHITLATTFKRPFQLILDYTENPNQYIQTPVDFVLEAVFAYTL